jgi:hypothetical protein
MIENSENDCAFDNKNSRTYKGVTFRFGFFEIAAKEINKFEKKRGELRE